MSEFITVVIILLIFIGLINIRRFLPGPSKAIYVEVTTQPQTQSQPQLTGEQDTSEDISSMSEEEAAFLKIYKKKADIPGSAVERSAYIMWLMKKEHYEEAYRVASL